MSNGFAQLGVSKELIKGLEELSITQPTPIQKEAIPYLLDKGRDLIGQAQTGTGKTAAFGLPLISRINPTSDKIQGLIISPTRELSKQISKQLFKFTKYTDKMFIETLTGGDKIERQKAGLRRPTQMVVATPGRLIELLELNALSLDDVRYLILDEADEMLKMGFKEQLYEIFKRCPNRQSTWLFSATFPEEINRMIRGCMAPDPKFIKVSPKRLVNRDISHYYTVLSHAEKDAYVMRFLERQGEERGLIFCRTKASANMLAKRLQEEDISAEAIQGDLTQLERDKIMRAFKKERLQFLVATDVAARGIDIEGLAFVLHYHLPDQPDYYTHRSGRTGRAGNKGESIVLAEPADRRRLKHLEEELGIHFLEK